MDKRIDVEQKAEEKESKSQHRFKKEKKKAVISFLHIMTIQEPKIKGVTDGPNQSCEEHGSQTNPQGMR